MQKLGDLYLRLMIAQIAILLAIAGAVLTFIIKTNDNNLRIAENVTDIKILLVTEQFEDKNIMKDLILPAYELSIKNSEILEKYGKNINYHDSSIKVNRSNILRTMNYIKPKGVSQ